MSYHCEAYVALVQCIYIRISTSVTTLMDLYRCKFAQLRQALTLLTVEITCQDQISSTLKWRNLEKQNFLQRSGAHDEIRKRRMGGIQNYTYIHFPSIYP